MAKLADAAVLATLHRECFEDAWDVPTFRRLLERPGVFAWLGGEAETYSHAFILIEVAADQAEILSLGSHAHVRRKGLARALIETAAAEAHRRGAIELFLEVAEDNEAALALYSGVGFVLCGRRPAYYHRGQKPPVDAVMLRAKLPL
jgi:ribosomal-protein-alanine N-acetyltransferase